MKIVIATAVYYPMINGVAVFSHNLAVGLAARGNEVLVICPSQTGKNHIEMQDGVKVCYLRSVQAKVYPDQIHEVPKKRRLFYKHGFRVSVFPQMEVSKILKEFQPDVVHVQISDPIGLSVVGYARRHEIPVVTTEHNQPEVLTEPLHMPGLVRRPVNALLSAYFRNRQSKSDFVTMPTKQAIEHLIYAKGEEFLVPVAAVSNGVDLSHFKPGRADKKIYDKYKIPLDKKIILYIGRVDPEKRVGLVIEAVDEMLRRGKVKTEDIMMLVVGDGVDKNRLEKKVDGTGLSGVVKFLGRVLPPDLYELYKVGSVFATASEIETQGIVLIEAAASGLPLVAVNKGAVAEVCVDGENGFLCQAGNVLEISVAIEKLLLDDKKREKFAQRSVEIAREHDFENTFDRFLNIYQRVIGNKK